MGTTGRCRRTSPHRHRGGADGDNKGSGSSRGSGTQPLPRPAAAAAAGRGAPRWKPAWESVVAAPPPSPRSCSQCVDVTAAAVAAAIAVASAAPAAKGTGGAEDASQGRLGLLSWSSRVIWAVYIESSNEHSLGHRRALAGRKEWLRSPEDKTGAVSDLRLGLAERMNHVAGVPLKIRHHTPFQQHPLRRRMSGRPREEKHNLREATDHSRPTGPRLVSLCSLSNTPGHPTDEPRGARWRRFVSVCGTSRLAGDCSQSRTPRLGARKNFFALDAAPLRAAANLTLRGWPVWAGCGSVRVARWM